MRDFFSDLLSTEAWLIREQGWTPQNIGVNETNLALGNGYVGSRAVLEEIPAGATPGTFFAGVFDAIGSQVAELVNAPNPFDFRIAMAGEKLGNAAMDVLEHKRILDMRKGLLLRKTIFSSSRKRRFDYQSVRFLSLADPRVGVMRIFLTPLDSTVTFEVRSSIDVSVSNMGLVTEGSKRHFALHDVSHHAGAQYLCVRTLEHGTHLAYASQLAVRHGGKKRTLPSNNHAFHLRLRKGETACFTKVFSFSTSREVRPKAIQGHTLRLLRRSVHSGFQTLLSKHCKAWDKLWRSSDFDIVGDLGVQRAIRFNIYHMLICSADHGIPAGIGAKSLSGEGYRGHSFWDTEIYTLPFYVYTRPLAARQLLRYRYERIEEARNIAAGKGFRGVMFPWESADTGKEATPSWYKDSQGVVRQVRTGEQEHHITADIAYGVWNYYAVTGDVDFMLRCGLEMLLEAARFWASRAVYNPRRKFYEIKGVIGPDEFHESVDNNAFTNTMALWNMESAEKARNALRKRYPKRIAKLERRIGLRPAEIRLWKGIRRRLANTPAFWKKGRVVEQFEGYFRKKDIPSLRTDEHGMPVFSKVLSADRLNSSQFIKQADVVLLLYLLPDLLDRKNVLKNHRYYEKRTLHGSSLSLPIYAVMSLASGNRKKAYEYLESSLHTDLRNIHKNSHMGAHIACCGGNWQTLFHGFGGVSVSKQMPHFAPILPESWSAMRFCLRWRGHTLNVEVDKERLRIHFPSHRRQDAVAVRVFGIRRVLRANRMHSFPLRQTQGQRPYSLRKSAPPGQE